MTRKEYLESLRKTLVPIEDTAVEDTDTPELVINSREHYMQIRRVLSDFENQPIELTEEDFRAFDRNFETCLEDLQFEDDDHYEVSDLEQAIDMMHAVDWEWATSTVDARGMHTPNADEFLKCARNLYEHLLEDPKPRMSVTSAGFTIELDIVDHAVRMTWGHINYEHYDNEY